MKLLNNNIVQDVKKQPVLISSQRSQQERVDLRIIETTESVQFRQRKADRQQNQSEKEGTRDELSPDGRQEAKQYIQEESMERQYVDKKLNSLEGESIIEFKIFKDNEKICTSKKICFALFLISLLITFLWLIHSGNKEGIKGYQQQINKKPKGSQTHEIQISNFKQEALLPVLPQISNIYLPPILRNLTQNQPSQQQLYCKFDKNVDVSNRIPALFQVVQLIKTLYGFNMYVDGKRNQDNSLNIVSSQLINKGTIHPQIVTLIGKMLRPGFTTMHIGAHYGFEGLIMAKLVGSKGKVFLLDPDSQSYQLLKINFQLNNELNHSTILKVGASDQNGKVTMKESPNQKGINMMAPNENGKMKSLISRLDDLIDKQVKFDFALIEAQYHQAQVILGMKKIIQNSPYLVMIIEWGYREMPFWARQPEKTQNVIAYLLQRSYKIYKPVNVDPVTCIVGQYNQIKDTKDLYNIEKTHLIFAPPTVVLPCK